MKFTVVITGSLRDRKHLEQVIDGSLELMASRPHLVREVVLSTTDTPKDVQIETKRWNSHPGFRVVCSEPPTIVVKGHRLHQLQQLDRALDSIEPNEWVLKLRTDKLVLPVQLMVGCIDRISADPAPHHGRFGILEGHLFLPWYINDMAFIAQTTTVREIVGFDVAADLIAPGLATEQVIWSRLLGYAANDFLKVACTFPRCHQLNPERDGFNGHDSAFADIRSILTAYWTTLSNRFFPFTNHRFKEPYRLQIGPIDVTSDRLFSRYGKWGLSFTDPSVLGDMLAALGDAK